MDDKKMDFQTVLDTDPEYQVHLLAFIHAKGQFQQLMHKLELTDKEIIYEYLGTLAELQMREIELALATKS